ncbi:MAG: zeta toxin family protein [Firmicutes bacterium]|nr:zeta toxin family protein [Bacillota bacterium]
MKIYTIIGGVNGAGKSSLTGVLKNQLRDLGVIVDVDRMTAQLGRGVLAGGKEAIAVIDDCMQKGVSFTQETTLSGVRTEQTVKTAKEQGYFIRLFYVGLDTFEESIKRIRNRVEKGGHDIPAEDVQRRFDGRFDALSKILPYCDEAAFFDNDNGFVEVAAYRNGEIIPLVEKRPKWLVELIAITK